MPVGDIYGFRSTQPGNSARTCGVAQTRQGPALLGSGHAPWRVVFLAPTGPFSDPTGVTPCGFTGWEIRGSSFNQPSQAAYSPVIRDLASAVPRSTASASARNLAHCRPRVRATGTPR